MKNFVLSVMSLLVLSASPAFAAPAGDHGKQNAKPHNMEKPMTREREEIRDQERQAYKESGEKTKGKKPWWKFWGSEQDS